MKFSLKESACAKNMFLNTPESLQEKVANQAITDILDFKDKHNLKKKKKLTRWMWNEVVFPKAFQIFFLNQSN